MLDKNNEGEVGTAGSQPEHLTVGVPKDVDYGSYADPYSQPHSNDSGMAKPLNTSTMSPSAQSRDGT